MKYSLGEEEFQKPAGSPRRQVVIGAGDHLQPRARDAVGEASGDDADLRMVVIADDDQRRYLDPVQAADSVLVGEKRMPLLGVGPGLGVLPTMGSMTPKPGARSLRFAQIVSSSSAMRPPSEPRCAAT